MLFFLKKIGQGLLACFLILDCYIESSEKPKLLIKIPTRERPIRLFEMLDQYYRLMSNEVDCEFMITCDVDDLSMNNPETIAKLQSYPNLSYSFGKRVNKIESYNRNLETKVFDLVLVGSDDMYPVMDNFDIKLFNLAKEYYPDYDCVINPYDGFIGSELNTIPIIGKKFYERMGYVYNPIYASVACDLELTLVSKLLKKEICVEELFFKHLHPCYGYPADNLYRHNDNKSLQEADLKLFRKRKALHFGFSETDSELLSTSLDIFGKSSQEIVWSILIPTLSSREECFSKIYLKLLDQIISNNLYHKVEILFFKDNKKYTVGFKRNKLLEKAKGKYVSFVDDDDMVSDDYVKMIYNVLMRDPDCVSLVGVLTSDGKSPRRFYHSIKYDHYYQRGLAYFRPPNHLNPIRKSIASQFKFPEINTGEDTDWAMQICHSGLLKNEINIRKPYYFYLYKRVKDY